MDFADRPITLIGSWYIHGQLIILTPNGALPNSNKPQLLSRIALRTFGVISIIENVKLVAGKIRTKFGDEEFVFGWFLFD